MEIPVFHKGDKLSETNNDLKPVSFLLQTILVGNKFLVYLFISFFLHHEKYYIVK